MELDFASLPSLLVETDTQVQAVGKVFERMLITDDEAEAKTLLRIVCTHVQPSHWFIEKFISLLETCPHPAAVVNSIGFLFSSNVATAAQMQRTIEIMHELTMNDSSLMLPVIGALAEMQLTTQQKEAQLVLLQNALRSADEGDVPTVVRALLHIATRDNVAGCVGRIRAEMQQISSSLTLLILDVLMTAIQCSTIICPAYLSQISSSPPVILLDVLLLARLLLVRRHRTAALRCVRSCVDAATFSPAVLEEAMSLGDQISAAGHAQSLAALLSSLLPLSALPSPLIPPLFAKAAATDEALGMMLLTDLLSLCSATNDSGRSDQPFVVAMSVLAICQPPPPPPASFFSLLFEYLSMRAPLLDPDMLQLLSAAAAGGGGERVESTLIDLRKNICRGDVAAMRAGLCIGSHMCANHILQHEEQHIVVGCVRQIAASLPPPNVPYMFDFFASTAHLMDPRDLEAIWHEILLPASRNICMDIEGACALIRVGGIVAAQKRFDANSRHPAAAWALLTALIVAYRTMHPQSVNDMTWRIEFPPSFLLFHEQGSWRPPSTATTDNNNISTTSIDFEFDEDMDTDQQRQESVTKKRVESDAKSKKDNIPNSVLESVRQQQEHLVFLGWTAFHSYCTGIAAAAAIGQGPTESQQNNFQKIIWSDRLARMRRLGFEVVNVYLHVSQISRTLRTFFTSNARCQRRRIAAKQQPEQSAASVESSSSSSLPVALKLEMDKLRAALWSAPRPPFALVATTVAALSSPTNSTRPSYFDCLVSVVAHLYFCVIDVLGAGDVRRKSGVRGLHNVVFRALFARSTLAHAKRRDDHDSQQDSSTATTSSAAAAAAAAAPITPSAAVDGGGGGNSEIDPSFFFSPSSSVSSVPPPPLALELLVETGALSNLVVLVSHASAVARTIGGEVGGPAAGTVEKRPERPLLWLCSYALRTIVQCVRYIDTMRSHLDQQQQHLPRRFLAALAEGCWRQARPFLLSLQTSGEGRTPSTGGASVREVNFSEMSESSAAKNILDWLQLLLPIIPERSLAVHCVDLFSLLAPLAGSRKTMLAGRLCLSLVISIFPHQDQEMEALCPRQFGTCDGRHLFHRKLTLESPLFVAAAAMGGVASGLQQMRLIAAALDLALTDETSTGATTTSSSSREIERRKQLRLGLPAVRDGNGAEYVEAMWEYAMMLTRRATEDPVTLLQLTGSACIIMTQAIWITRRSNNPSVYLTSVYAISVAFRPLADRVKRCVFNATSPTFVDPRSGDNSSLKLLMEYVFLLTSVAGSLCRRAKRGIHAGNVLTEQQKVKAKNSSVKTRKSKKETTTKAASNSENSAIPDAAAAAAATAASFKFVLQGTNASVMARHLPPARSRVEMVIATATEECSLHELQVSSAAAVHKQGKKLPTGFRFGPLALPGLDSPVIFTPEALLPFGAKDSELIVSDDMDEAEELEEERSGENGSNSNGKNTAANSSKNGNDAKNVFFDEAETDNEGDDDDSSDGSEICPLDFVAHGMEAKKKKEASIANKSKESGNKKKKGSSSSNNAKKSLQQQQTRKNNKKKRSAGSDEDDSGESDDSESILSDADETDVSDGGWISNQDDDNDDDDDDDDGEEKNDFDNNDDDDDDDGFETIVIDFSKSQKQQKQ